MAMNLTTISALMQAPRPDGGMLPVVSLVDGDHTTVATGKDDKTVVLEE